MNSYKGDTSIFGYAEECKKLILVQKAQAKFRVCVAIATAVAFYEGGRPRASRIGLR